MSWSPDPPTKKGHYAVRTKTGKPDRAVIPAYVGASKGKGDDRLVVHFFGTTTLRSVDERPDLEWHPLEMPR